MFKNLLSNRKVPSLRLFITAAVSLIVTVILLFSVLFYYIRTSNILRNNAEQSIIQQLNQVNQLIMEQIDSIDSIIPLFLSNSMILNTLESSNPGYSNPESRFNIERQMSYIYYSTALSGKNFTNSIYIICDDNTFFSTYTSVSPKPTADWSREILNNIDKSQTKLICMTLDSDDNTIYFARNIFNSNTGKRMGTFIININRNKWIDFCTKGVDSSWFIYLYNSKVNVLSNSLMENQSSDLKAHITPQNSSISFQELSLCNEDYFIAAQKLRDIGLTSTVVAPKELLLKDLNKTLQSYLLLLACTVFIALFAAIIISQAITKPIKKMIYHINQISVGKQSCLPHMKIYHEFDVWADSFNQMLKQLDIYYNDNFQKQLLLKNAEIQNLQSQMNPHFMFNVLNTIAWKAQISDNEEIYQMVISLGEILRMNILSKDKAFLPLEKEMEYVKFYIYLQQMRFEEKISCNIQIPEFLKGCEIPVFCIQPLVENSIVHGLEPKKGKGTLAIQAFKLNEDTMEISIIDNGIGFAQIPSIQDIGGSETGTHTHIGLKNLDKRLELLFGQEARLRISSVPNVCTSVSFNIPIKKGGVL